MSAMEKSDLPEVARKRANKAASAAAEPVERRGGAKENADVQSTVRTQSREAVSQAQARIREAVTRNRQDELTALLPPAYVKPYVKRHKNDAADAEAICEAVTRRNMRFVPTKTPEQQSCLTLHRTRRLFIRQQTAIINSIRAHLAEFGIVAPVGRRGVEQLLKVVADA